MREPHSVHSSEGLRYPCRIKHLKPLALPDVSCYRNVVLKGAKGR